MLNPDRVIRRLKTTMCCILAGSGPTANQYSYVKRAYKRILSEVWYNQVYKEDLATLERLLSKIEVKFCCADIILLTNEEGDSDLAYPLGVISVEGDYIGIANNASEYISLWNSNLDNQAVGTIVSGSGTSMRVQLVDPLTSTALTALEFYTVTSNNNNAVMHVSDNDIVVYGAGIAVRGSTGTSTASSAVDVYNGTFGVTVETAFNVRRITTVSTAGSEIHVLHSRVSTRIGMNTLTDCQTLSGVLPKACITLGLRITQSTDLVSNVANWDELQSIESWTVMGLGGGVYNLLDPSLIPAPPPSVKALGLRDVGALLGVSLADFTWFTFSGLPNLRRILASSNLGDLIGLSLTEGWFATMPRVDKQLTLTNNSGVLTSAANSDAAIIAVAAALVAVVPVTPKVIRLQNTTNRTAASAAASAQLTGATWTVTYT